MRRLYPLLVILLGTVLTSCGPLPFTRIYGGTSEANVRWTSGGANSSVASPSASSTPLESTATQNSVTPRASQPEYDAYYATLGDKKHTYTPERFKLWSWTLVSNPVEHVELTDYWDECNYAQLTQTDPEIIYPGFYDVLFILVANADGVHEHNGRSFVPRNSVVVSMPEYGGGVLADEAHYDGINMNVEYLGDDKYHFSWIELMPQPPGLRDIHYIIFGPFESQRLFVSDSYNTGVLTGNYDYGGSDTNQYSILVPWEGVTVGSQSVTFRVALDLTNIIEVYEGPTGDHSDDSDDIVILANRFWDRFTLEAVEN